MWVEDKTQNLFSERKKSGNVFATGITPSGPIHVGNGREVMTTELVYRLAKKSDKKARLIYIADDFDRLRKVYPFLPKSYKKYIGQPLINIPDPEGCHQSYAQHFLAPFFESLEKLGVKVEKISATKMYQEGIFTSQITTAFEKKDQIKKILEEISNRSLPDDWQPFEPLCKKCGRIDSGRITKVDIGKTKANYICQKCGYEGESDWSKGEGKLPWRIEWPARWQILGVTFEAFGKDHGASGGSWDTAKAISKNVFGYQPPFPTRYEFIYLKGEKGKMSSSLGNLVSLNDFLMIISPEIVRYMFAITKPNRHIVFDPGEGLIKLTNQYSALEQKINNGKGDKNDQLTYELSQVGNSGQDDPMVVSFRHLVEIYQSAQGDEKEIERILSQTGYKKDLGDSRRLKEQISRIKVWLEKYAPDRYRFNIIKEAPEIELSPDQKELLDEIADYLTKNDLPKGEDVHNQIYKIGKKLGLSPKESFEPVYLSLINKKSGPKAGWFITTIDKDFVIERFKQIANQ